MSKQRICRLEEGNPDSQKRKPKWSNNTLKLTSCLILTGAQYARGWRHGLTSNSHWSSWFSSKAECWHVQPCSAWLGSLLRISATMTTKMIVENRETSWAERPEVASSADNGLVKTRLPETQTQTHARTHTSVSQFSSDTLHESMCSSWQTWSLSVTCAH